MSNDPAATVAVFTVDGVSSDDVRVLQVATHEGMSQSFECEVDLELADLEVDPHAWTLKQATLLIVSTADGRVLRRLTGPVLRVVEHATAHADKQRLTVRIGSPLSVLKLTSDFRLFQDQTSEGIVTKMLEEAGLESSKVSFRLSEKYLEREVCTQFGESGFAFVSRVLEEDGIAWFFEFGEEGTTVVFADAPGAYFDDGREIAFRDASGLRPGEHVTGIAEVERMRPARVTLRDHDFEKPRLDLEAEAQAPAPLDRELYDHPGRYRTPAEGKRRASALRDSFEQRAVTLRCEGWAPSAVPGHKFTLVGAPESAWDREWVVTEVEHLWQDHYGESSLSTVFFAMPSDAPPRPPRTTPRAQVPGPQLAKVRGPAGSEIHCDQHGRIKVAFVWDRHASQDDKSSAWVRVGQCFLSGAVAIPRIGWEVLVDFEEGDPDRPIVLGRVYNPVFAPPYALPAKKTMSALQSFTSPGGGGTNEIRMEDAGGAEQVMVHAQKDMNVVVANNRTEKVATNEQRIVGSNQTIDIGSNQTIDVGAASQLAVGGAQTWSVSGSRTKSVASEEKVDVKGARSLSIGGSHTQVTPMSSSYTTAGSFSETVAGSCVEAAAMGLSIAVGGAASFTVGAAKIEAAGSGKSDTTVGAHATTVGGAMITAAGGDANVGVGGARATTVGGAWAASAGGDVQLTAASSLSITVGGAVSFNATKIVLKVGGSNVTVAGGAVSIESKTIKLTATGPHSELAPMVGDK